MVSHALNERAPVTRKVAPQARDMFLRELLSFLE